MRIDRYGPPPTEDAPLVGLQLTAAEVGQLAQALLLADMVMADPDLRARLGLMLAMLQRAERALPGWFYRE